MPKIKQQKPLATMCNKFIHPLMYLFFLLY